MWEKVDLRTCTWMRQSISPTQEFADRQPASDVDMCGLQNIACALRTRPHELRGGQNGKRMSSIRRRIPSQYTEAPGSVQCFEVRHRMTEAN